MEEMLIKYNEKYDRWVTKDGLVYRYSKRQEKLVLCGLVNHSNGYLEVHVPTPKKAKVYVHRLVYETFIGEIPQGFEIDHINALRADNRLENLRCVTHKENQNNPLSIKNRSESLKGRNWSEFGAKFKEHYGKTNYDDKNLYYREFHWYRNHNKKCRWE